jgi:hypothetical protein
MDIDNIWLRVLEKGKCNWSVDSLETWIAPLIPSLYGSQLLLLCNNTFTKEWIGSRYLKDLEIIVHDIEPNITEILLKTKEMEVPKGMDHDNEFKTLVIEHLKKIDAKLESNERFQEIVVRCFGEIKDKLSIIDITQDRLDRHARRHHDEIELVAIQIRGLQREPSKDDTANYFTGKKFMLVFQDEK